jgi:sulfoxide reductase heme-binding subunit YedZ
VTTLPLPWLDRSGKLSPVKTAIFVALFVPALVNTAEFALGMLGARPLTAYIHALGLWAVRLLLVTLLITPLRQATRASSLIHLRRMIGVAAFCYLAVHFAAYIADQSFNLETVALEIVRRLYLTIGFVALLILLALTVTSTDGVQRRLGGKRWMRLHQLVYLAAALGVLHYFIQAKADVWEPTIVIGLLGWLLIYRLVAGYAGTRRAAAPATLALVSVGVALLTAAGEAGYFRLHNHVDPERLLGAYLTLDTGLRPGWVVLAGGLLITAAALARLALDRLKARAPSSAPAR